MAELVTTLGRKGAGEVGMILPHEHVFVDLRTWNQPGYAEGQAEDVIRARCQRPLHMDAEVERVIDGGRIIVAPGVAGKAGQKTIPFFAEMPETALAEQIAAALVVVAHGEAKGKIELIGFLARVVPETECQF